MSLLGGITKSIGGLFGDEQKMDTVTQTPWGPQQQYLQDLFQRGQAFADQGGPYYPDFSTVAPFNPYQTQALEGMAAYGMGPQLQQQIGAAQGANQFALNPMANPYLGAGFASYMPSQMNLMGAMNRGAGDVSIRDPNVPRETINQMMSGQPNMATWQPAIDAATNNAIEKFNRDVMPELRANSIGAGQYGGPRADLATAKAYDYATENLLNTTAQMGAQAGSEALGQQRAGVNAALAGSNMGLQGDVARQGAVNQLYGQGINAAQTGLGAGQSMYNPTMSMMMQGIGASPQMSQYGMMPYQTLYGVGGAYQGQGQAELTDQVNRWMAENRTGPMQDLQTYQNLVSGNYGQTTNTPYYTGGDAMGGIMGGLTGGYLGSLVPGFGAGPGSMLGPAGWVGMGLGALTGSGILS